MTDEDRAVGPLDVATLEVLAQRAASHPVVDSWRFEPDSMSPRRLTLHLDDSQYPSSVETVRLDIRWFEGGDYAVHYVESRGRETWQCRWDRHRKPGEPREHFHPPPAAGSDVEPSDIPGAHHLAVLFGALDWITGRIEEVHGS